MATSIEQPLETGYRPDTPVDDTLFRRFLHNQAEVNAAQAAAVGGRHEQQEDVFLADSGGPVPYFNQAILTRPLTGPGDTVLNTIDAFFGPPTQPVTLLSIWPTPDRSSRGWSLMGHPAFVLRAPGPSGHRPADGVRLTEAVTASDRATAERIAIDGYPLEEARDAPPGQVFGAGLRDAGLVVRLGLLGGEAVAIGNLFVGHGIANLCLGVTLPQARRRGVWEALVWARVDAAPELPAVAYTSDFSRPGFIRMGFIPITRFTFWARHP